MKKFLKIKIIISLIIMFLTVLLNGTVYAVGAKAESTSILGSKDVSYLFELIRTMESEEGTLGIESDINPTTYIDETHNGIDCHLVKNTEYGTMGLLALSDYGLESKSYTGESNTGCYLGESRYTYTASVYSNEKNGSIIENSHNKALVSADLRYVNKYYGTSNNYIVGDGKEEWDAYSGNGTYNLSASILVWRRAYSGSAKLKVLGMDEMSGVESQYTGAYAVIVCGAGL